MSNAGYIFIFCLTEKDIVFSIENTISFIYYVKYLPPDSSLSLKYDIKSPNKTA